MNTVRRNKIAYLTIMLLDPEFWLEEDSLSIKEFFEKLSIEKKYLNTAVKVLKFGPKYIGWNEIVNKYPEIFSGKTKESDEEYISRVISILDSEKLEDYWFDRIYEVLSEVRKAVSNQIALEYIVDNAESFVTAGVTQDAIQEATKYLIQFVEELDGRVILDTYDHINLFEQIVPVIFDKQKDVFRELPEEYIDKYKAVISLPTECSDTELF